MEVLKGQVTGRHRDLCLLFPVCSVSPLWLHVPLPLVQEESWPSLITPVSCAQINTRSLTSRTTFTNSHFQMEFGKNLMISWSRVLSESSCGFCETCRLPGVPLQRCAVSPACSASQFQILKEVQSK